MTTSIPQGASDWETSPSKSGLVSIGTHFLYVSVSGPPRTQPSSPNQPIVIILPGAGDTIRSYPAVSRLLTPTTRHLLYDRSGLGRSEDRPAPKSMPEPESDTNPPSNAQSKPPATTTTTPTAIGTAVLAATELHTLLHSTSIPPPYILASHSYGSIIAREFLALHPNSVSGMVLADGASESQPRYFRVPDPNVAALLGTLNFALITGLRADAQISRDEWRARAAERPRCLAATNVESGAFVEVCETLGKKGQYEACALGRRPLSVIRCNGVRDFERVYEAGVRAGNGTEEERKGFRELLDGMDAFDREIKEEQLRLSSWNRFVYLEDCGHNVQLIRPDVLVEEIRGVVDNVVKGKRRAGGL